MIILNPYETSIGMLINSSNITKELTKYLAVNDVDSLAYEYHSDSDSKIVFITGCNEDEKELPIWEHPIVFEDIKKQTIVAVDVRKFVKTSEEQPMNIYDIVRDKSSLDFVVIRGLITLDFVNGETGKHRDIFKHSSTGLALWVSTIINAIVGLNPIEKASVEVAVNFYASLLFIKQEDTKEMLDGIKARVSKSSYSVKLTPKMIDAIIEKLNPEVSELEDLIDMIKLTLPDDKAKFVDINTIINMLSNSWYGPGSSETVIMGLDHAPTWIALLYVNVENRSYKRTKLGSVIEKSNRNIKGQDVVKHIELYLKERTK